MSRTKSHHQKARVSKKAIAAQSARNEAMATRSLKRKLDLQKAVVTSIGNAIKKLQASRGRRGADGTLADLSQTTYGLRIH